MIRQKWTRAFCCVLLCIISIGLLHVNSVLAAPTKKSAARDSGKKVVKPAVFEDGPGRITADAAVLMDAATGDVLFGKQENKRRPPASTTKIMTAILGFELGKPAEVVTVSQKAADVGESTIHLDPGEKITLYELLTGALVRSGNDACVAIAEDIAGSEEKFVRLMNRKAIALGAENTHFENTNGLPLKNHYSTAYDLALMARHGLQIPQFASIIRQRETKIQFLNPDVLMDLRNTNKLLWNYPYADGVKTGTTTAAGKCLVASATKDGRQLLAVLLNAPDRFGDAKKLLEWGFEKTETLRLVSPGEAVSEFRGTKQSVKVFSKTPLEISIPKAKRQSVQTRVLWEKPAVDPIQAGERLGRLEVWLGNQKKCSVPLFSEGRVSGSLLN